MRRVARTAVEIICIAAAISATLLSGYWFLSRFLGLPILFVVAVIGSTAVLSALAAIYGYCIGWARHYAGDEPEAAGRIRSFQHHFRLFVFAAVIALPLSLSVVSVSHNITVATLFLVVAVAAASWSLHKIRRERRRSTGRYS